jgi:hypothetical protein
MAVYKEKKEKLKNSSIGDIDAKLLEILENYRTIILTYIKDVTGKPVDKISDEEIYNYIIDMIYISTKGKYSNKLIQEFCSLTKQEVKENLAQNAYVRDVLNEKFGVKRDYKFESKIGDHGICDSLDFSVKDISHILNKNITDEQFRLVSDEYITKVLDVIKRNPNLNIYFIYNSKKYDDIKIIDNYNQFLDGKTELNMENKIIFKEMTNLIATYSLDELINKKEDVKKEIDSGVYDFIKMPNPKFSQNEREKLNGITHIWNRQDIANYKNLSLLSKRYTDIIENADDKDVLKITSIIDEINNAIVSDIPQKDDNIIGKFSDDMNKWYSYFEKVNREGIMNLVYSSNSSNNITSREDVPSSLLVHFYNPAANISDIFKLVAINRMRLKNNEEPIILEQLSDIYKNQILKIKIEEDFERFKEDIEKINIDECTDELNPSKTFCFKDDDIEFPRKDVIEASSKQLACYLINKESVIDLLENDKRMTSGNGNIAFAVGFSKNRVSPKNILLSCTSNANSNMGIDNIPCEDKFVDLEKTHRELTEVTNQRTEVLLNREGIQPDYLLILKGKEIDEYDNELINNEIKKAEKLGIDILSIDIGEINKSEIEKNMHDEEIAR